MLDITQIQSQFDLDLSAATDTESLLDIRTKYIGRKQGILTQAFAELPSLSMEQKQTLGPKLNELKSYIETGLIKQERTLEGTGVQVDLTMPPYERPIGHLHPVTQVQQELERIFHNLGFITILTQEVESDWHNFTALNIPPHHPARDMQDTFYVDHPGKEQLVLRTHTSPGQIRFMQTHKPPFSIIIPGRVYRNEATDATHEHTFDQLEGLVVGETVTYANMMWLLKYVMQEFFGPEVKVKFLPSYFPFVEPGAEVAISHPDFRGGEWMELLGCGMVHQNVFEAAGYKRNQYQGFAFGAGLTRFTLMKYKIPDIRLLTENNLQFLSQF